MTAWSKDKPTEPGLYWWRTEIAHAPGVCRVVRGGVLSADPQELWVRVEGIEHATRLANTCAFFEWQLVEGPKP